MKKSKFGLPATILSFAAYFDSKYTLYITSKN
jgi:hypothetical protein